MATYQKLYYHIAHSVITVTACFITYPAWPSIVKKRGFIAFAWPLGMGYILFVVGSVLMVLSGFHQVQVMLFILNMVLAALLIDWPLLVFILLSGVILAMGVFHMYVGGVPNLVSDKSVQFRALYGLPLLISLLLAIISFRRSKKSLVTQKEYLLRVQKEDRAKLVEVASFRQELLKEIDPDEVRIFDPATSAYLKQAIYQVRDYLRLEVSEIGIEELVLAIRSLVSEQPIEPAPQLVFELNTRYQAIQADIPKIKQLVVNGVSYLQKHNTTSVPVHIIIEDTLLGYEFSHMPDYLRKIAAIRIIITTAKELPALPEVYLSQEMTMSSGSLAYEDFPLLENARIIDANYGYLEQSRKDLHLYVIPVHVREVRGKVMELLKEPVAADPLELSHPLAIELERKLLDRLKGSKVELQVIERALNTIKKYHAGVKRKL